MEHKNSSENDFKRENQRCNLKLRSSPAKNNLCCQCSSVRPDGPPSPSSSAQSSKDQTFTQRCYHNSNFYGKILGPTPDETILAGLQTVIDMCSIDIQRYTTRHVGSENHGSNKMRKESKEKDDTDSERYAKIIAQEAPHKSLTSESSESMSSTNTESNSEQEEGTEEVDKEEDMPLSTPCTSTTSASSVSTFQRSDFDSNTNSNNLLSKSSSNSEGLRGLRTRLLGYSENEMETINESPETSDTEYTAKSFEEQSDTSPNSLLGNQSVEKTEISDDKSSELMQISNSPSLDSLKNFKIALGSSETVQFSFMPQMSDLHSDKNVQASLKRKLTSTTVQTSLVSPSVCSDKAIQTSFISKIHKSLQTSDLLEPTSSTESLKNKPILNKKFVQTSSVQSTKALQTSGIVRMCSKKLHALKMLKKEKSNGKENFSTDIYGPAKFNVVSCITETEVQFKDSSETPNPPDETDTHTNPTEELIIQKNELTQMIAVEIEKLQEFINNSLRFLQNNAHEKEVTQTSLNEIRALQEVINSRLKVIKDAQQQQAPPGTRTNRHNDDDDDGKIRDSHNSGSQKMIYGASHEEEKEEHYGLGLSKRPAELRRRNESPVQLHDAETQTTFNKRSRQIFIEESEQADLMPLRREDEEDAIPTKEGPMQKNLRECVPTYLDYLQSGGVKMITDRKWTDEYLMKNKSVKSHRFCSTIREVSPQKAQHQFSSEPSGFCQIDARSKLESQAGDGNVSIPTEIRYAIARITKFDKFSTFEILKSTRCKPRIIPNSTESIFVLKNKHK